MSGFVRNDWGKYLNGGSSHYNFEYRSPQPAHLPNLIPTSVSPSVSPPTSMPNTSHLKKNNKDGKMVIPTHKGGKRKSLHSRRSHKRSNKKYRRTHRK
jgi:hypothetical protein